MPEAALRPCTYPGCPRLVKAGRCELHAVKRDAEVHRLYDRRWQRIRRMHLAKNPWCAECLRGGLYVPAVDVHHVTPHRGSRQIFMTSELESLCHSCHSKTTVAESREGG